MARTKGAARRTLHKRAREASVAKQPEKKSTHRWKPGTVALREIRRQQKSTDLLLKKAPTQRIIANILRANHAGMRIQAKALPVIMEAMQALQVKLFAETQLACIHARRQMITVADLRYACHNMQLDCPTAEERTQMHRQMQAKLRAAAAAKARAEQQQRDAETAAEQEEEAEDQASDGEEDEELEAVDSTEE